MVIIRRTSLKFVLLTHTYHSTDCDTDHSLVCPKHRQPKKLHRTKPVGKPCIGTTMMKYPEKVAEFANSLEDALSADHPHDTASEN